jgi:ribose transport system permease protein
MKKLVGVAIFLAILYGILWAAGPSAMSVENHKNLAHRVGMFGILTLAAAFVIVTGHIDLSMGSVVALCAVVFAMLVSERGVSLALAIPGVLLMGAVLGLVNGLLVAYLRLPSFVVTLCGMFVYRGVARWISGDLNKGLGELHEDLAQWVNAGELLGLPVPFTVLLVLLAVMGFLLHFTVYGRYFYAIGSNERAARYSGVPTQLYSILAFVLCSTLTAFYSILFVFNSASVQPTQIAISYELSAITAAVLGGFSLRGGEGLAVGVLFGTCILQVLPNLAGMYRIPNTLEPVFIGMALLIGATVDEILRRRRAVRKA